MEPNRDGEQTPRPARSDLDIVCEVAELDQEQRGYAEDFEGCTDGVSGCIAKLVAALARVPRKLSIDTMSMTKEQR